MDYDFGDLAKPVEAKSYDFGDLAKPVKEAAPEHQEAPKVPKSAMETGGVGALEALANMGTSMVAKPIADVAGLGDMLKEDIAPSKNNTGSEPLDVQKKVQNALTYEPRTDAGKRFAEYNPVSLIGKGVNAVSGFTKNAIAPPTVPADSLRGQVGNAVGEGINQIPNLVGAKFAPKALGIEPPPTRFAPPASPIAAAVVRFGGKEFDGPNHLAALKKAMDAGAVAKDAEGKVKLQPGDSYNLFRTTDGKIIDRNQAGELTGGKRTEDMPPMAPPVDPKTRIFREGREAGLKAKPASVSDSSINSFFQGLAGDAKTGQLTSKKSQPAIQNLVRKALKLEPDEPLNDYAFNKVRANAHQKYEAVKGIGEVKTGDEYNQALDKIEAEDQSANKAFPKGGESPISKMVETLREPGFPADGAIAKIRQLRKDADKSFRTGDGALGKAQKQAALALENELDRAAVDKYGADNTLVKDFRDARKDIAMSYAAQAATDTGTGTVTAAKLGKALKNGKVLTGELKLLGEFSNAFGRSIADTKNLPPNVSAPDIAMGAIPAALHGNLMYLPASLLRPGLRQFMTSDWYQNRLAAPPSGHPIARGVGAALPLGQSQEQ